MRLVVKKIIIQRKKKELEPMIRVLDEMSGIQTKDPASEEFKKIVSELKLFSSKADATLDALIKSDSNWLFSTFLNFIK
jgi:hypothetical protein